MEQVQPTWLLHLEHAIPREAKNKKISLYTIALEGWRRGLRLSFHSIRGTDGEYQLRYSLSSSTGRHFFQGSKGDKISEEAQAICDDKSRTNAILQEHQVPVPLGRTFCAEATDEDILQYAEHLGYPLVLKPTNASGGKGVVVNMQTEKELKAALAYVRNQLELREVILEQFVTGEECRVLVLDGKVIAAVQRAPANVIGDGRKSIAELIEQKNRDRKKVPHLLDRPIKLDKQFYNTMHESSWTLKTVPAKGERVVVKRVSNISAGGDPVDVTDILSREIKEVAVQAAAAIPDLPHSGVDLMVDFLNNKAVAIEVNTRPGLGSHLFPIEGTSRDVPKALIDFYFPESKDLPRADHLYFELRDIEAAVKSGDAAEIEVQPAEQSSYYAKQITCSTKQLRHRKQEIEQFLRKHRCIGRVIIKKNAEMEAVIAHTEKTVVNDFLQFLQGIGIEQVTAERYFLPLAMELTWLDDTYPRPTTEYYAAQQALAEWNAENKKLTKTNRQLENIKQRITQKFAKKMK